MPQGYAGCKPAVHAFDTTAANPRPDRLRGLPLSERRTDDPDAALRVLSDTLAEPVVGQDEIGDVLDDGLCDPRQPKGGAGLSRSRNGAAGSDLGP